MITIYFITKSILNCLNCLNILVYLKSLFMEYLLLYYKFTFQVFIYFKLLTCNLNLDHNEIFRDNRVSTTNNSLRRAFLLK